jgi:hypothetical protein
MLRMKVAGSFEKLVNTTPYGVTSQKIVIFIVTAVRTS